ncbi:hypothetical protein COOONC_14033 [Cooperia oncophora]
MSITTKRSEQPNNNTPFGRMKSNSLVIRSSPSINEMPERNMSRLQPLEMPKKFKDCLIKNYRDILLEQRPDAFHKAMLQCIRSSPKINEIIACQKYCYRDLTKWPKLNQICQAQQNFYTRQIEDFRLDGMTVAEEAFRLGSVHYAYAKYGLKPHFLDLFVLHFETVLQRLKFPSDEEKHTFITAFRQLNMFITSTMNLAYSLCQQQSFQSR